MIASSFFFVFVKHDSLVHTTCCCKCFFDKNLSNGVGEFGLLLGILGLLSLWIILGL